MVWRNSSFRRVSDWSAWNQDWRPFAVLSRRLDLTWLQEESQGDFKWPPCFVFVLFARCCKKNQEGRVFFFCYLRKMWDFSKRSWFEFVAIAKKIQAYASQLQTCLLKDCGNNRQTKGKRLVKLKYCFNYSSAAVELIFRRFAMVAISLVVYIQTSYLWLENPFKIKFY